MLRLITMPVYLSMCLLPMRAYVHVYAHVHGHVYVRVLCPGVACLSTYTTSRCVCVCVCVYV